MRPGILGRLPGTQGDTLRVALRRVEARLYDAEIHLYEVLVDAQGLTQNEMEQAHQVIEGIAAQRGRLRGMFEEA